MSCSPVRVLLFSALALLLAGCSATLSNTSSSPLPTATFSGRVHGGEQPVSGARIQLYTVGTTADGSASTPLLTGTVTSDSNGNFSITGLYSCTGATEVYLVATGGNPGLGAPNPNLALMTALGPCTGLTPQSFISVNELTTVSAVYALQPFFTDAAHIGSSPADAPTLAAAFALANGLVSSSPGTIQTNPSLTVPATQINTLADIVAACINTPGGTAGDTSICGRLFTLASAGGAPAPANTLAALLNIAANPTSNVAQLYSLVPAAAPFQPSLPASPPDLAIQQTASANVASGLHIGPPTLAFPSTTLGLTAPSQTIAISNPTPAPISLTAITLTGGNAADFTQTNTCGSALAPFTACTAAITFAPGAVSARTASLSIASATPDSPQFITLGGSGIAMPSGPHAGVDAQAVGIYPGASFDVHLSNTGNTPLVISSIALAGTPFNTQKNDCPGSLAPSATCTISIHSLASGADQLTILTNDGNFQPNILIFQPLNAPAAVFTPSDVFFADTVLGAISSYGYVYNPSATVTPTISGPQASEFSATTPDCSATISYDFQPGGCTFTVRFTPAASGLRAARLALDSSGNYIPLAGMAIGSARTSNPFSQVFQDFTYYPIPQSIAIPASASNIQIQSLTGTPEFTQNNNCGSTAPGAYCTVNLASNRLSEGGAQELLTLTYGADTYSLRLDNSLFQVINFGDTAYSSSPSGTQDSYPVVVEASNGYGGLSGTIAEAPWTSFSISGCSTLTGVCLAEINFTPNLPGIQTGNVEMNATGSGPRILQFIVLGEGVATEPAAKLMLKQSGFSSTGYAGNLTLINPGPHTLNLTGPALSGADPQNFTLGQASCTQPSAAGTTYPAVAKGSLCTIPITFKGTQTGFSAATATFTDTVSGLTFSLPLYLDTLASPALSPSSLLFPATPIYSLSAPQSVTVVRDVTHPVTSATSGGLVAVKGSCAAGETPCILTFAFAPANLSDRPAATITDSALGTSAGLSVTGTPEHITVYSSGVVSTLTVDFPPQRLGSTSAVQTVTLTSEGPNPLTIYSLTLAGANASEFTETNNCPVILPVNATCTFNISLTPATYGYKEAGVIIEDSADPGDPVTLRLSGATN